MSSLLYAELAATCNALGYLQGDKYITDEYCQESIKDLIRYLRRDDENHEIRRYLGEGKILQSDLLPILKDHWENADMFDVVLRLLVNLTNPALLLYREELPAEKTSRNFYLQIISHLQSYKEAFCDDHVWAVLSKRLKDILEIDSMEREEDKGLVIERILILARNVLQVPADPEAEKRADNDASIHDQLLWALNQSGMVDLFLYIASSENEQQYYMHILEIVSLMLREQNPAFLAVAAITRSTQEKERDEVELLAIRQEEVRRRQEKVKQFTGARHSRFGGTYVLKNMKSISDNALIYHKPLNKLDSLDFDHDKVKQKRPKNRLPMKGGDGERRSDFSVRLFLKEFCVEFLNGAYNTLMYHVKDGLVRAKAQANDESYYMWALKFFMEFNRNYKFQVKLVSETMSVQAFHFIQTQLENCYDMLTSDKKKLLLWSRRMHLALRAYQELLMTLMAMDRSEDPNVRESSKVIKSNIFYVVEYRELILTLTLNFDEIKFSKSYLKDLLETAHVFLKMLEQFSSKRNIVVQKRHTARKRKTKKSNPKPQASAPTRNPEEIWDEEISQQLSTVLQGEGEIPNVVPFDATSERDIDEQRADAMIRIQTYLREFKFEEAIGLLRAAREVWPENDFFGSPNMPPEEEFLAMKDIFVANLQGPDERTEENQQNENENEDDEEENEEEEQARNISVAEQDFNFIEFARRFAHHKVVQSCSLLLKQFERNTVQVNHCIIKMLHRIAWDCKMPAMLFQASLFRTFQRILDSKLDQHKEMAKFAIFIIRKFIEVAKTNGKVYMELLFWKTVRDAFDIEQGYGSYQEKSHSTKQVWSEEEELELRRLYDEFMNRQNAEDNENEGGGNVLDWIMENLINDSRSHRGVAKKLRELGYNIPTKATRKPATTRPPREWSEEEEEQLRELYEEFKIAQDPLGCIIDRLTVRRPKPRIVEKLLEMGLVQDKKELRKKRARKGKSAGPPGEDSAESDISDGGSNSEDNSDSDGSGPAKPRAAPAPKKPQANAKPSKKPTSSKKRKPPVKQFSSAELSSILTQVVAAGMSEALRWLSSNLEEVADDREADGDEESIPLLPLSEESMSAMDNAQFHRLLMAVGVVPPFDEQEMYWRIPGTLTPADLRKRVEVIGQALDGNLATGNNDAENNETSQNNEDDVEGSSNTVIDADDNTQESIPQSSKKSKSKKKKQKEESSDIDDDSISRSSSRASDYSKVSTSSSRKKKASKKQTKKVIRMDSDSEGEDNISGLTRETADLIAENEEVNTETNGKSKNKNRLLDSDSETEEMSISLLSGLNGNINGTSQTSKHKSRNVLKDSDSEEENTNTVSQGNNKRIQSDSDSGDELPHHNKRNSTQAEESTEVVSNVKRRNKRIRSDSESEEEVQHSENKINGLSQSKDDDLSGKADLRKRLRALASDDDDD